MHRLERRKLGVLPLAATIFFVVSGGPYTVEQVIGKSGPGAGLLILALIPLLWCLPIGLMTAELTARFPEEGGYFVWVKQGLGPFAGFLCAWWSWTSSWVDLALYPLIAVEYASRITGQIAHPHLCVFAIIAAITLWNLLGVRSVGGLSVGLFLFILVPFIILTGFGAHAWMVHPPHPIPFLNDGFKWDGLGAAMVLGLWNYFGWDSLTTTAGEVDHAAQVFPKAILLGIALVSAMILLPVLAGIALKTHWTDWDADAGYWPEIATAAWPPLKFAIVVGGVLSNIGLFAANLLASSRIPYVLAEDRYLPGIVFKEHLRFGTPWVALLISAVISAVLSRESFEKLVAVDLSLYLFALMLEFAALLMLRRRGVPKGQFKIGGGRAGLVFCVVSPVSVAMVALFLQLDPATKLGELPFSPLILLLGLALIGPIYFGLSRLFGRSSRLAE